VVEMNELDYVKNNMKKALENTVYNQLKYIYYISKLREIEPDPDKGFEIMRDVIENCKIRVPAGMNVDVKACKEKMMTEFLATVQKYRSQNAQEGQSQCQNT